MSSDAEPRTGAGVLAKVSNNIGKRFIAIVALFIVASIVLTTIFFIGIEGKAATNYTTGSTPDVRYADQIGTNISELQTTKEVTNLGDGVYKVHLEAFQSAQSLTQPNLDIMLALDVSKRMNDTLYLRDFANLNNASSFTKVALSSSNHSQMYDSENPDFERSLEGWGIEERYDNKKYIKDPNVSNLSDDDNKIGPNTFVYLSQSFNESSSTETKNALVGTDYRVTYTYNIKYRFTDSHGNEYETDSIPISSTSIWFNSLAGGETSAYLAARFAAFIAIGTTRINSLSFKLVDPDNATGTIIKGTEDNPYVVTNFYTRDKDDDVALNSNLLNMQDVQNRQLYIRDNNGVLREMEITPVYGNYGPDALDPYKNQDHIIDYVYTVDFDEEDESGNTVHRHYEAHQGNAYYGADHGVFQGFKSYKYDDINNKWVVDFDNTLVSKKIYYSLTNAEINNGAGNVSRLQSMKEAVERYLLMIYMSAYEHQDGAKIHVGVATYGNTGKLAEYDRTSGLFGTGLGASASQMNLDAFNMASETEVSRMIDTLYSFTASNNDTESRIDQAMNVIKNEFTNHLTRSNPHCDAEQEPKRITVVFSAGVPSNSGRGTGENVFDLIDYLLNRNTTKWNNYWDYRYSSQKFNVPVATAALEQANQIKNDLGSQIYTVGMFGYADQSQLYGDKFYYYSGDTSSYFDDYNNETGAVGTYWGYTSAAYRQLQNNIWNRRRDTNIDPIEAAASNRFLNYLSSNYMDTDAIGIRRRDDWNPNGYSLTEIISLFSSAGDGFRIIKNFSRASDEYYTAVDTEGENPDLTNDLIAAFNDIALKTQIPDTELHTDALFTDVISDYFDMVPGTLTVSEKHISDNSPITGPAQNLTVLLDGNEVGNDNTSGKEITVSGFDYSYYNSTARYTDYKGAYGDHTIGATYNTDDRKLVVEFEIQRTDDFIGGNNVPTNLGSSGITDGGQRMEELFKIPHVDIPLINETMTDSVSIYAGEKIDLDELINIAELNGFNNEFVTVVYTLTEPGPNGETITYTVQPGESEGLWSRLDNSTANASKNHPTLYQTQEYTISYRITVDESVGTLRNATDAIDTSSTPDTVYAYVFQPSITEKDGSVKENASGTSVDLSVKESIDDGYIAIDWVCPNHTDAADPVGDAPELTLTIKNLTASGTPTFTVKTTDLSYLYSLAESTDFQIINVATPEYKYSYTYMPSSATDTRTDPIELTIAPHSLVNGTEVTFFNELNTKVDGTSTPNDTNGNFTILTKKPAYPVYLTKIFDGSYAVEENVTFTIAPSTGATQDNTITFQVLASEFSALRTQDLYVGGLEYGVTYELTETHQNDSLYDTSFVGAYKVEGSQDTAISDEVANDGEKFTFTVSENASYYDEDGELHLTITNQYDESQAPVPTGISDSKAFKVNPFIIVAIVVAVLGGAYVAFIVRRKSQAID